jgi:hypothetical protein
VQGSCRGKSERKHRRLVRRKTSLIGGKFVNFVDCTRKNGRSKSFVEISQSSVGRWILRRCKEITARTSEGSEIRKGRVVIQASQGPWIVREIAYRDLVRKVSNIWQRESRSPEMR